MTKTYISPNGGDLMVMNVMVESVKTNTLNKQQLKIFVNLDHGSLPQEVVGNTPWILTTNNRFPVSTHPFGENKGASQNGSWG